MDRHQELRSITASQHGVVARRQLADLGFDKHAVANAISTGRLERLTERVLRLGGSPDTLHQRAMAACLDVADAAVALHTAAALWGLPGFTPEPIHVLSGRRPHRGGRHLGRVHSTTRWAESDVTTLDGIPITTPIRTLQDLAGRVHGDRLSLVCDRMLGRRLLRVEQLSALASELPERGGPPGTSALRRLIRERPPGHRPPESNLERRFERILEQAGEEPFERQVDLGDETGWIGRVEFVDRRARLVVEVQSDLFHGGAADRHRDEVRLGPLRRAGWRVIEVTEHEVWHRPDLVVARVRSARTPTGDADPRWLTWSQPVRPGEPPGRLVASLAHVVATCPTR